MVKVLAICAGSPDNVYGGMETHARNLYANMDADITYLTLRDDYVQEGKPYKIVHPQVGYHYPPDNENKMANILANNRLMFMEAMKYKVDIVHAHDWIAVITAMDLKEKFGIPFVTTFHLFQHQIDEVEEFNRTDEGMYMKIMELNGVAKSDEVIVCSKYMQEYIKRKLKTEREAKLIYNAIPLDEFDCEPIDFKCDKPVVLFCGRLSGQKGIKELLETIPKTNEFMFVIMGRIPSVTENTTHPFVVAINHLQKKYPDRLKWLKHIEGKERFRWFKRADIGLVPSLCEPFGIVAREFQASQTPLVTTAVDGLAEFVNEDNAFIIPDAKPESIIAGLKRADRSKVDKGYIETTKNTWSKIAQETVKVYEEVLYEVHKN